MARATTPPTTPPTIAPVELEEFEDGGALVPGCDFLVLKCGTVLEKTESKELLKPPEGCLTVAPPFSLDDG